MKYIRDVTGLALDKEDKKKITATVEEIRKKKIWKAKNY